MVITIGRFLFVGLRQSIRVMKSSMTVGRTNAEAFSVV